MFDRIEIVVALWENVGYQGHRLLLSEDAPRLSAFGFDNKTSAIGIHPGPDFDEGKEYKISFFQHAGYAGEQLVLEPGGYPSLVAPYGFNDKISSVRFEKGVPQAHAISPIPLVVEAFADKDFAGRKVLIYENVYNLHSYADFGDRISSVRVHQGPDFKQGDEVKMYRDVAWEGGGISLAPGSYANLHTTHHFGDVVSSMKIR